MKSDRKYLLTVLFFIPKGSDNYLQAMKMSFT